MHLLLCKHLKTNPKTPVVIGFCLLAISYGIIFHDPLEKFVDYEISIQKYSILHYIFREPNIDLYFKAYLFNITNAEAFLSGDDTNLKISEIGPYVYKESLVNVNGTFNPNGTYSYVPVRTLSFVPEKSAGDPTKDIIIAPNIPLLGAASLAGDISFFTALAFRTVSSATNSQPTLNLTVFDYLWGYNDTLVSLASSVLPSVIPFERLGIMDRLMDEGLNTITIHRKESIQYLLRQEEKESSRSARSIDENEEISALPIIRENSISLVNGVGGLSEWGYQHGDDYSGNTVCNMLTGSHDGILFPRNVSKDTNYRLFRRTFCRTIPLEYSHSKSFRYVNTNVYELPANAFDGDLDDPRNACACKDNKCLRKGLGNMAPCYYSIPAAISFPHFLHGDKTLFNKIDGLKPDNKKHGSQMIIQPNLGVPMQATLRAQLNLLTSRSRVNPDIEPFDDMALPLAWIEIALEKLPPMIYLLIIAIEIVLPILQQLILVISIICGLTLLSLGLVSCIVDLSEGDPFKKDIRYSVVNVLPFKHDNTVVSKLTETV